MSVKLPQRRLVSQNDSAIIQQPQTPRSRFIGSWTHKTAFDAGKLIPFLVDEILPGDFMRYDVTAYLRMSTPLFPMMDNQRVDTFFFFVPNRLVWDNWVKFMGEQDNPADSIVFTIPQVNLAVNGPVVGSIYDYMGVPTVGQVNVGASPAVSALPLRMYNLIWNTWFRDQNINNSVTVAKTNGPDASATYDLLYRAKAHDYFTSALPWPQKFTAPTVPLAGFAPILGLGKAAGGANAGPSAAVRETDSAATTTYALYSNLWDPGVANQVLFEMADAAVPAIYADLSVSTGVAINTLRQAWLIQSLLERDARGGTRYTELIRSHFGVTNPDFRLQRPEYIGGGQSPLNITPIAQTAPTTGVPLGALGAAGTSAGQHRASYAATEHGYIIGLINVRSEISYQQGLERHWKRSTRYDFYWPALAGLGEQAITRGEIYMTGDTSTDAVVFGYQERWHEYRTKVSRVSGIMRSTAASTIDMWHLSQKFLSAPSLSATFIRDEPPMTRVLAAGAAANGQQYLADIMITRNAVRPIPMFGTPSQLGRF